MELQELKDRYVNPYTDFGFKKLFGSEMNKDLLISFINSLLSGEEVVPDLPQHGTPRDGRSRPESRIRRLLPE